MKLKQKKNKVWKLFFYHLYLRQKTTKRGLNVIKFNILSKNSKKKIIALGGINKKNINNLKITNAYGFSGISYFLDEK